MTSILPPISQSLVLGSHKYKRFFLLVLLYGPYCGSWQVTNLSVIPTNTVKWPNAELNPNLVFNMALVEFLLQICKIRNGSFALIIIDVRPRFKASRHNTLVLANLPPRLSGVEILFHISFGMLLCRKIYIPLQERQIRTFYLKVFPLVFRRAYRNYFS